MCRSLKFFSFVLICAFFVFSACSNLFDDIETPSAVSQNQPGASDEFITLTGSVSNPQTQAGAQDSLRMALPTASYSDTRYYVTATPSDGSGSVSGNVNSTNHTFTIALSLGKVWTIKLGMQKRESTDADYKTVLEGTYTFDHALTASDAANPISIVLAPLSTGTGNIDLDINISTDLCDSFSVGVLSEPVAGEWETKYSDYGKELDVADLTDGTYKIELNGITSGTHKIELVFRNTAGIDVYSCTQVINVFQNMTTDRWISGGGLSAITSDGTFAVTSSLVESYARQQFYVGETSFCDHPADTNQGSAYESLATVGEAIRRLTDSTKDYTIRISGTQVGPFTLGVTENVAPNFAARSVTLCGMTGNTTDILSVAGVATILTITTTAPVTIRKLKISSGYNTSENSAGINMEAGSKLILDNGALVTMNSGYMRGAGIYATGENTEIVMNSGSKVSDNALRYSGENGYNYNFGGAGVYISGSGITDNSKLPKLTINTGAEISDNTATAFCRGGGIYAENAIVSINGGKITGNKAGDCAGNIYVVGSNSSLTMTAGEISNGEVNSGATYGSDGTNAYGGGVVMFGGTFEMSGGKICNNKAVPDSGGGGNGGGISMGSATFIMTGGEISGNSVVGTDIKAGAINFEDTNAVFEIGGSAYIPYGVEGVTGAGKNDIYVGANKKITILSALTGTSPVATIVPASPSEGLAVLEKDSNASADDFAAACGKIAVTPNGSTSYYLDSEGKLITPALALPSSSSDIISGNTYAVVNSSAMEKLAEFSSEGCDFSGVTLKLDADITIDTEWTPIGNETSFNGTFDGNGKTVTFDSEIHAEAFFGTVGGTVRNLKVDGSASVAGIAKTANSSAVIENCESSATVTSSTTQYFCAGIVAEVQGNAKIIRCVNTGSITSNFVLSEDNVSYGAGGITGSIYGGGIVDSCVNTGSVIGPNAGGITASVDSSSTIRNAYNSGNITSTGLHAGGISAVSQGNGSDINQASHIDNCFNGGDVTAEGTENEVYAGGIVGKHGWGNASWAQNCLNIGNVSISESARSGSYVGALFGLKDGWSQIDFCYYKDGCAGAGFGTGESSSDTENECIKAAQSGTNDAVISAEVTLNETNYSADTSIVLSLLNAWVTENNTDDIYTEWEAGENYWPKLKTE